MNKSRRDFIAASAGMGILSVTKAAAQATTKRIGFVVSTADMPGHVASFLQGLDDAGWQTATKKATVVWASAGGKYGSGHDDLQKHAAKHILRGVDVIVAAGGLMTAIAAAKACGAAAASAANVPPFVYLLGRSPASASGDDVDAADLFNSTYKAGGVDQNIPAQNEANFQMLQTVSNGVVTAANVGLIVNDNNAITKPETTLWTKSGGHDPRFIYRLQGENDQGLSPMLQKLRLANPQPAGIVVSCDPFIRSLGPAFDAQLRAPNGGKFTGWVCYPFREYLDPLAANPNSLVSSTTPALATDDPTDQNSAYYQLGKKTAQVLDRIVAGTTTNVGVVAWDGKNKKWT
jgi:hypothetical protein